MDPAQEQRLFELADLVLALSRQLQASKLNASGSSEAWTPLESAVMRFVDRNPGTTAGVAADATHTVSSNFSRALRTLEKKGLVRREQDGQDARRVLLHPTEGARQNLRRLHTIWAALLDGTVEDAGELEATIATLRTIEDRLNDRTGKRDARPSRGSLPIEPAGP